ncbi:hypothetical protein VTO73DRAFT_10964 [Trametes versicolor]
MVYVAVAAVHNAEAEMNVVGQAGQVAEEAGEKVIKAAFRSHSLQATTSSARFATASTALLFLHNEKVHRQQHAKTDPRWPFRVSIVQRSTELARGVFEKVPGNVSS